MKARIRQNRNIKDQWSTNEVEITDALRAESDKRAKQLIQFENGKFFEKGYYDLELCEDNGFPMDFETLIA